MRIQTSEMLQTPAVEYTVDSFITSVGRVPARFLDRNFIVRQSSFVSLFKQLLSFCTSGIVYTMILFNALSITE